MSKEDVLKALGSVSDPELGRDVVSLHMVEDVRVEDGVVSFTLNLTTPACPLRTRIEDGVREAIGRLPGVKGLQLKVSSNVMATRPFDETGVLKGVKNVIAVASGKGGVGKSTIAVNLAVALASSGAKVGLLDADVYGPNIPLMMGVNATPAVEGEIIIPPMAHGVKVCSLGFFYKDETPLIWRGPLVAGAVRQLLTKVAWGDLDYLVIDLPPGCLPSGTLVLTATNVPKKIEEIKVGEFVLSYDGSKLVPRRVTGVFPQGKQEVFKVRTPNRTIMASGNHPFLKYTRRGYAWRRVDRLRAGGRILVSNFIEGGQPLTLPVIEHDPRKIELPAVTSSDFMRLVGHFVGDGFIKRQKGRKEPVGVRICEPRGGKFRQSYEEFYHQVLKCHTLDDNKGQKFAAASTPLAKLFIALDLDHKAKAKRIPDWVFTLPAHQRQAFIRGYAEADSTIRHRESAKALPDWSGRYRLISIVQDTVVVESTNEPLVRQLHELCTMSGLRATNVSTRTRQKQKLPEGRMFKESVCYRFQFSLKLDNSPFKLARITEITPMGELDTYDLQVEEYQNFVANSFVVHNTGDASLTLAQTVPLGGVIIVTTPQEAALTIATKALAMFRKLNVPILGIVENMSYFLCPHCGEKSYIFSTGGGRRVSSLLNVDFLGEIPLESRIREQSDLGSPVVAAYPNSPEATVFKDFAFRVAGMISIVAYASLEVK